MGLPAQDSAEAVVWLLMLALDADGVRRGAEIAEFDECLLELGLYDPEERRQFLSRALFSYQQSYDRHLARQALDALMEDVVHLIERPELKFTVYDMLVRVAIADRELHQSENAMLKKISLIWGPEFGGV